MRQIFWLLCIGLLPLGCREKPSKKISDEGLTIAELISLAPVLPLPAIVHDSTLRRKEADASILSTKDFLAFLPDSVARTFFPSTKKLRLYILGAIEDAEKGHYLLLKSVNGSKASAFLFYFNRKNEYFAAKQIGGGIAEKGTIRYCKIDDRYNIIMVEEKKQNGSLSIRETTYYLDAGGNFTLVMTNSNEDLSAEIRGNHIDTFPRKNKYAADYAKDKKNLVSIRDGNTEKSFVFFIHFSKQNDDCIGELKGEAVWIDKQNAVFRDQNSPCMLYFSFSPNTVRIQEENGCGSYRDITCLFEGVYPRKKDLLRKKSARR